MQYRIGVNALIINVGESRLAEIHGGELELHPLRQGARGGHELEWAVEGRRDTARVTRLAHHSGTSAHTHTSARYSAHEAIAGARTPHYTRSGGRADIASWCGWEVGRNGRRAVAFVEVAICMQFHSASNC